MAINSAGSGPPSLASNFITAASIPDPPTNVVSLYADHSFITIGWNPPTYNGGSPVLGYNILWDSGLGLGFSYLDKTDHNIPIYSCSNGVIEGNVYSFKVIAFNVIGNSSTS